MTVKYEKRGETTALVTLNRPQTLNAFDAAMRADLLDAMTRASADATLRAVVITGEGRGFSAGADVTDASSPRTIEDILNTEYGAFLSVIMTCEKPVIAAINGPAAGIGMTLALACDLRVMGEDAYLMSAFSNIGLVPDGGLSWLLTQEVGYARAYQLAVEAEKIPAARCLELGLVNRVVPGERVVPESLEWAASLAERAPLALAATKRAFRAAAQSGLRNAMAYEAMLQKTLIATEDCREGVMALMQKRKPAFNGR
ncbi:enoyl-CoA hydratase/isomerase family protein [Amphiplicatus metriothermophilus]|uniref:Short chain enoyl-CoA hydratase /Enoyl-CoA hydratase n=1 Tax=Amphiplicatus metriothermophilus TaxID=1519374 RepID=A0A239PPM3_9PROT|nr:enoyl-CoA hydratase-related protein [Amphiplicatus metriothermophilus]MBB5518590.1 2-(1,2-epoxy-1,2-dihydrophenyl)acetyl-CoA isomerase [Amphiplicatus metriothermophilus]SNT72251.1 short chain enoyl-CoA hydratase /Enoyl-CoA hydratase [Amphiplicatus metriothermophilus]